jgi:hypothetical protein
MQPADPHGLRLTALAVALRRRTPWEAIDLGLSMLQRWWRAVYGPHLAVGGAVAAVALATAAVLGKPWLAIVAMWWMKPLYDRVVLHVLSHAVFGDLPRLRDVLASREWLHTGFYAAFLLRLWPDPARSFNLPVRQLEGQSGGAGRERRGVLGRRAGSYAVWLTFVCLSFEVVFYLMLGGLAELALPAKAAEGSGQNFFEAVFSGDFWTYGGAVGYAVAVLLLEPFYVAAGFGLYLNRRTQLEGWDIEVALRRLAERHAAAAGVLLLSLCCFFALPTDSYAQKNPREEIAEVLKAKEFGYEREAMRWQSRNPDKPPEKSDADPRALWGIGYALAKAAEVLLWILAGAALAYALWFLARMLPRGRAPLPAPYLPPRALFGMDLAPESLPADVAAAAAALAREGKLREALSLLYRGALSNLVHRRGVQLLPSHTEAEVLSLSGQDVHAYLEKLIATWRLCAYARRDPAPADIEHLAQGYQASFA